jgi:hypothetical protein
MLTKRDGSALDAALTPSSSEPSGWARFTLPQVAMLGAAILAAWLLVVGLLFVLT